SNVTQEIKRTAPIATSPAVASPPSSQRAGSKAMTSNAPHATKFTMAVTVSQVAWRFRFICSIPAHIGFVLIPFNLRFFLLSRNLVWGSEEQAVSCLAQINAYLDLPENKTNLRAKLAARTPFRSTLHNADVERTVLGHFAERHIVPAALCPATR